VNQDINNLAIKLTEQISGALLLELNKVQARHDAYTVPSYYTVREIIWKILSESIMELHCEQQYSLDILKQRRMSPDDMKNYEEQKMARMFADEILKHKDVALKSWKYETPYYESNRYSLFILRNEAVTK
jgi:hypothetical protein